MKKAVLKSFNYIFFLSIALVLLYYAFRGVEIDKLKVAFAKVDYFWVFLSIIAAIISYISRALRWNLLIEPLGYKPKAIRTFYALMVGYFANIAFPRLGEIVRCGSLNKSEKIPVSRLFGTVLIERASDLIVLFALLIFVFVVKIDFFGAFLYENILSPIFKKFQSLYSYSWATFIVFLAIFLVIFLFFIFRQKINKTRFIRIVKLNIYGVISGVKTIISMRKRRLYIFHTILIWFMYFLMTYLVFFSIEETSVLKPIDGLFMTIVGGIGMSLPAPGGIGSYHYFTSLGLTLYGISRKSGIGIAYAIVVHESQALLVILLGIISLIALFLIRRKIKKNVRN